MTVLSDSAWSKLTNRQHLRVYKLDPSSTLSEMIEFINSIEPPFKGRWKLTPYLGKDICELKVHAQYHGQY